MGANIGVAPTKVNESRKSGKKNMLTIDWRIMYALL